MANFQLRLADQATVIADLRALITNCTTDIAANDSDADVIKRLKEQGDKALEAFGLAADESSIT